MFCQKFKLYYHLGDQERCHNLSLYFILINISLLYFSILHFASEQLFKFVTLDCSELYRKRKQTTCGCGGGDVGGGSGGVVVNEYMSLYSLLAVLQTWAILPCYLVLGAISQLLFR